MQPITNSHDGNPVYVETVAQLKRDGALPDGFFSAGIVLPKEWRTEEVAWDLNSLFGGTFSDEAFRAGSGARTFSFWGERADEAHNLCDVLRDAWFHRDDADDTVVLTMSTEADAIEDLIDSVLLILPAPGYIDGLKYSLFMVPDDASAVAVQDAIRRQGRPGA